MEKGHLGAGQAIPNENPETPMDTEGLQQMLANGPSVQESENKPEPPPMPNTKEEIPTEGDSSFSPGETQDEKDLVNKKDEIRKYTVLPPEKTQKALKEKWGELRVVPIPYSRPDDKVKAYILRPLTRAQWRKAEENAVRLAEAKGEMNQAMLQELIAEKVVAQSVVWPNVSEHELPMQRAGLIPTLFGIVQKISWFFDSEALMDATFAL